MVRSASSLDYDRPFLTIFLNDPSITREMHRRTELCVPVLPVRMPISSNDDDVGNAGDQVAGVFQVVAHRCRQQ